MIFIRKNLFYISLKEMAFTFMRLKVIINLKKGLVEYVLRYTGRPVMAESRIDYVDHTNRLITYTYLPHEDDQLDEAEKNGPITITEDIFLFEFVKNCQKAHQRYSLKNNFRR